jgi:hypothetical protein
MTVRLIAIAAGAALALSASEAAAPQILSFNCDAVPGEVTAMDQARLTAATAISGSFRAIQARHDNSVSPVATVKLASDKDFVALQITPIEPNSSTFLIFVRNGDAKEEERTMLGQAELNQPVPFRIARNGKQVDVSAAGQSLSLRQSFRGTPSLGVTCSTGQFLFENLELR